MSPSDERQDGAREQIASKGAEALGDLANALLDNPVFKQAVSTAAGARDQALSAQRAAMDAMNLPSAAEQDRLERRMRSISDRLETVEEQLDTISADVATIKRHLTGSGAGPVSADQAKFRVEGS